MTCSIALLESFCSPGSRIAAALTFGASFLSRFGEKNTMAVPLVAFVNIVILAAILWCLWRGLRAAQREARGKAMSLQRLGAVPALAAAASALGFVGPVDRPHDVVLWVMALALGLVLGVVRGNFVIVQVDREQRLMRTRGSEDGLLAVKLLIAISALDVLAMSMQRQESFWHPLLATCAGACAAFLVGRFASVWWRARAECHMELRRTAPGAAELLVERGAATWSSNTARMVPGYVAVIPPAWRELEGSVEEVECASTAIVRVSPTRCARKTLRDSRGRFISTSAREGVMSASSLHLADTSASSMGDA